jgi:hypothetical protein
VCKRTLSSVLPPPFTQQLGYAPRAGKSANLNNALKSLAYQQFAGNPSQIPLGELVVVFDADMQVWAARVGRAQGLAPPLAVPAARRLTRAVSRVGSSREQQRPS